MNPRRKELLKAAIVFCLLTGLSFPIVLGFLGLYHQALDAFSHLRFHLSVAMAVVALAIIAFTRYRREALLGLIFALAALATTAQPMLAPLIAPASAAPDENAATYRLMHLNLRFDNPDPGKALSLIGRLKPDVITLAEVSDAWKPRLDLLKASYPYSKVCQVERHIGGVAILSRRPFAAEGEPRCLLDGIMASATVLFGDRPVDVAALHLGWPWPMGHHWHIGQLRSRFEALGPDALLGGDFNAVDWSEAVRRVAAYSGMKPLRVGPTWLHRDLPRSWRRWIGLPLDHAMVKGDIRIISAATGDDAGSDHLPLVVDFSLEAKAEVMSASVAQAGAAPHLAAAILSP